MKVFLIVTAIILLSYSSVFAQKVSLSLDNTTMENVLNTISKQTKSLFLYKEDLIKGIKVSSFKVTNMELTGVLDLLCTRYDLDYKIIAGTISIFKKERATTPPSIKPQLRRGGR